MLDIGWSELLIVGVVALIVVGPKDLPKMFRTLGQVTGKMRAMAREFQRAMDAAADDAGVKDVKNMARDLRQATRPDALKRAAGLDDVERDFREMEAHIAREMDADEAAAREYDAATTARLKRDTPPPAAPQSATPPPSGSERTQDPSGPSAAAASPPDTAR